MSRPVDELAELAEALREDPVIVDPLFGNGHTAEVDAALTEMVEGLDFPAYVVLVPAPEGLSASGPDRELATLLHDRLGGDGVFLVRTDPMGYGDAVVSFGDVPGDDLISRVESEMRPEGGADADLSAAGAVARDLEVIASGGSITEDEYDAYTEQALWRDPPEWDLDYEAPMPGTYAVFTTMAFVAVAGVAWLVLRTLARWRATAPADRKPSPRPAAGDGPREVRASAERELEELSRRLAASAGKPQQAESRVLVDGSYDTARSVLERAGTTERDLDDLVGALVLTRIAARALTWRRKPGTPYRACFFDPRHGEGVHRMTVPVGDRELSVPACPRCDRAGQADLAPMTVPSGVLGRDRPWYEHDTVWARTGYGAFVDDLWQHVASDHRAAR